MRPVVLAEALAFRRDDGPGLARQVARQELAERALADEADAGGILLGVVRQPRLARDPPDLGLAQVPHGKDRPRELGLRQAMQEVATGPSRDRLPSAARSVRRAPRRGRSARSRCARRPWPRRGRGTP